MKRTICLILAVLFCVALFAGCGGNNAGNSGGGSASGSGSSTPATSKPADSGSSADTGSDSGAGEEAPPVNDSPYHLAAGKYAVDERGVPLEKYTYEVPLTTSDEVFTYWTGVMLPDQIDVDDYEGMPHPSLLRETTGVHIEYLIVASASRASNCAVLVASDDLPDLCSDLNYYYPGTMREAISDGYTANLYDYWDYMPNYAYCIWDHEDDISVRAKLMPDDQTIFQFHCLNDVLKTTWGGAVRGDWVADLGMNIDDIVTFDDLHDLLLAFQSQMGCQYPFLLLNSLDPHTYWSGFDTICNPNATVAPLFVQDGKVRFACSTENDLNYMTTLNSWYNDGLISPNWASRASNNDLIPELVNGEVGLCSMVPSEQYGYVDNTIDPDACWKAIHKPRRYEGQIFHLGNVATWVNYGTWAISAKCANIPLLVSYCDYFYSDEGAIIANWGVEGYTFYFDENGNRMLTDFIVNNPGGSGWAILNFTMNNLNDAGILIGARNEAKPGGELDAEFCHTWDDPNFYVCDNAMLYPTAIQYSAEDTNRLATIGTDIQTFIQENYLMFVDNSRPISEWDSYVEELTSLAGWDEALEINQRYYDEFMVRFQ